jgi:imidazolonepropionase-like amidohydrolase
MKTKLNNNKLYYLFTLVKNNTMKKILFILQIFVATSLFAQDDILPAKANTGYILIKNATIHTGTGQVLSNSSILINKTKIEKIEANIAAPDASTVIVDASGKHIYPSFIASNTQNGIREISGSVNGSNDYRELGEINTNVRSIIAYNADSKIINTLRSNGIFFTNVVPIGSLLAGTSSVVHFDAWNWQDAAYSMDNGHHLYLPSLFARPSRGDDGQGGDPLKVARERIESVKKFFREAKAYQVSKPEITNLKFEAVKGLFMKKQKLFVHCNLVREMLTAIDFVKEFNFDVVLVGASEAWQIAPLLKENNIAVILSQMHSLPLAADDDIDQPFKTPAALKNAGVLFAINDEDETTTGRNLVFNAGTASVNGLTKEEALQAITLNAAKILGIADKTGSIEVGKDANILISEGDVLDMKSHKIVKAYVQGRDVNLDDKHKQLNRKYKERYGLK